MTQFVEGLEGIAWDGEITGVIVVVPSEGDAAEEASVPIRGDFVFFCQGIDEMLGIGDGAILDAKVVDDEAKLDGFGDVLPKAGCVFGRFIPVRFEVFL